MKQMLKLFEDEGTEAIFNFHLVLSLLSWSIKSSLLILVTYSHVHFVNVKYIGMVFHFSNEVVNEFMNIFSTIVKNVDLFDFTNYQYMNQIMKLIKNNPIFIQKYGQTGIDMVRLVPSL